MRELLANVREINHSVQPRTYVLTRVDILIHTAIQVANLVIQGAIGIIGMTVVATTEAVTIITHSATVEMIATTDADVGGK